MVPKPAILLFILFLTYCPSQMNDQLQSTYLSGTTFDAIGNLWLITCKGS